MKLNLILTSATAALIALASQGCLPNISSSEGERSTEEIFSFRNETGKDVKTCVYFYEKEFTQKERDLMELANQISTLETQVKTLSAVENPAPAEKTELDKLSGELTQKRPEYAKLYSQVNSPDYDKEIYKELESGDKVQVGDARAMLQNSIVRFVSDPRFTNEIKDRKNIYMFGANLAVFVGEDLYLYDLAPLYRNVVHYEKGTYDVTPTIPVFFPFHYNWNYYRVDLRKDGKMQEDYRLKRLIVASFMPAYNFGVGKRDMPRNGTLVYQLVLLDDMKLYVREISDSIKEYWGSRDDFTAKFKDRQDEYKGFPISPARKIDADELKKIDETKSGDDFTWATYEPKRLPLPESRRTFDESMYGIMRNSVKAKINKN